MDIDAATKHKIKVARIPGSTTGNAASCAEMAIYFMLGLLRKQVGFQSSNCLSLMPTGTYDILFHILHYKIDIHTHIHYSECMN